MLFQFYCVVIPLTYVIYCIDVKIMLVIQYPTCRLIFISATYIQ